MTCPECGDGFTRKHSNHIFCQNKCLQKNQYKKHRTLKRASELIRAKEKYQRLGRTPTWRYGYYRVGAKRRNHSFNISFELFKTLIQQPCYYCGDDGIQMGIDRINNKVGYETANVRSCCPKCNVAKHNLSEEEFYCMCSKITKRHHL